MIEEDFRLPAVHLGIACLPSVDSETSQLNSSAKSRAKPDEGKSAAALRPADAGLVVAKQDRPRVASARARQIYLHASRLFVEKGYEGASMSDIAAAVNITKAGLYHFVKSKEDLLFTIVSFGMDEVFDEVVNPAREVADPKERLALIIRNHLLNIGRVGSPSGNPVTIVANDTSGLSPENRRIIAGRKREYFNQIRDTLGELQARGDMPAELDPSVAAHSILGAILWTAHWRRPGGKLSLDQIIDQITASLLFGVLRS